MTRFSISLSAAVFALALATGAVTDGVVLPALLSSFESVNASREFVFRICKHVSSKRFAAE